MSLESRLSLATCLGEALAKTESLFIPLQAMFHFRLALAEKMHLKLLILCSFSVRNIFACRSVTITPKTSTCHGVESSSSGLTRSRKLTESTDCRFEASLVTLKSVRA